MELSDLGRGEIRPMAYQHYIRVPGGHVASSYSCVVGWGALSDVPEVAPKRSTDVTVPAKK